MAGTIVANTLNTDTGLFSTNNAYLGMAKAWVNYNGSTQTINNSFNVSSVTRVGSGDYTVNFSTAMPNANYVFAATAQNTSGVGTFISQKTSTTPTTTYCEFYVVTTAVTLVDTPIFCVTFFGN